MDLLFKSIYSTVTSNIQKSLGRCLGCIIDSVIVLVFQGIIP